MPPRKDTADFLVELPTEVGQGYWDQAAADPDVVSPLRSSDQFEQAFATSDEEVARRAAAEPDYGDTPWPDFFKPGAASLVTRGGLL